MITTDRKDRFAATLFRDLMEQQPTLQLLIAK